MSNEVWIRRYDTARYSLYVYGKMSTTFQTSVDCLLLWVCLFTSFCSASLCASSSSASAFALTPCPLRKSVVLPWAKRCEGWRGQNEVMCLLLFFCLQKVNKVILESGFLNGSFGMPFIERSSPAHHQHHLRHWYRRHHHHHYHHRVIIAGDCLLIALLKPINVLHLFLREQHSI